MEWFVGEEEEVVEVLGFVGVKEEVVEVLGFVEVDEVVKGWSLWG